MQTSNIEDDQRLIKGGEVLDGGLSMQHYPGTSTSPNPPSFSEGKEIVPTKFKKTPQNHARP